MTTVQTISDVIDDDVVRKAVDWTAAAALEHTVEAGGDAGTSLALLRAGVTPSELAGPLPLAADGKLAGMERRPPKWRGWVEQRVRATELLAATARVCFARSWWQRGKVQVVSVLAIFNTALGAEWKVALRRTTDSRASPSDLARVLRDFRMTGAEECNPYPSAWRTFYASVEPGRRRSSLPTTERVITEADGYRWSTPLDGPCRGCMYALAFPAVPCSVHAHGTALAVSGGIT